MVDDNEYPPHLALIRCPPPRRLPLAPAMIKRPLDENEYPPHLALIRCPPPRRLPLAPAMIKHPPPPIPAAPVRYSPVPVLIRHPPPRRPAPTPIRCPPSSPASFRHPPSRQPCESLATGFSRHPPDVVLCSYVPDLQHKHDGHYSDCQKLYFKRYYTSRDGYVPINGYIHIKNYIPFTIDCDTYRPVRIDLRPLKKSFLGQQLWRRHSFPTFPSDEWQGFWRL